MRFIWFLIMICGLGFGAYVSLQQKLPTEAELQNLSVGMSEEEVVELLGEPLNRNSKQFIYTLDETADLVISFQASRMSSATLRFNNPLRLEDTNADSLSLVQIAVDPENPNKPSWFYAGMPEKGQIWKITSDGLVLSRSWVTPFSVYPSDAKDLQALLRDFKTHHISL